MTSEFPGLDTGNWQWCLSMRVCYCPAASSGPGVGGKNVEGFWMAGRDQGSNGVENIGECVCSVNRSCPTLQLMDSSPPGSSVHEDSSGKNTGVGCHALLQGIFPTQGWNPGLPNCRQILYQLSHQGSPRILEFAAYPFSTRTFLPRNHSRVSCIAGRFFFQLSYRKAQSKGSGLKKTSSVKTYSLPNP